MSQETEKLQQSISDLEHALSFEKKIEKDSFYFSGISKSFETCFEYAWKYFKQLVLEEGVDVYSPKDAIKRAGQMGFVDHVELWLKFLETRNKAVHDDIGVSTEDYLQLIKDFYKEVKSLNIV